MSLYSTFIEKLGKSKLGYFLILRVFTYIDRRVMRWTNGRLSMVTGSKLGKHTLLLTSTGAKSGKKRDTPLVYVQDGKQLILIASSAGAPKNPAWYYNLKKNPRCEVRAQGDKFWCEAREVDGEERTRAWQKANSLYSGYDVYKQRTDRKIPVLILTPVAP